MTENICSERSTRWRVRENIRQSASVWHFFKQLGMWLFSALTTKSTVGSKISAEFKISGFSLLLVLPEMCLAGITVKQQETEPKRKEEKTQNLRFILRWRKNWKCPRGYLEVIQEQYCSDLHPAVCTVSIPPLMCQHYIHEAQIDVDR